MFQVSQSLGGAFALAAEQYVFANKIISTLPTFAPCVDVFIEMATGATDIHKTFTPEQLPGDLVAYIQYIKATFAIGIGLGKRHGCRRNYDMT